MKSSYRFTLALSVCLLLLVPVGVFAQTTGTVEGSVTDQSGAPLPGVTVSLASPALQGSRTAVTGSDGRYRFPALSPGRYEVTATLSGFGKRSEGGKRHSREDADRPARDVSLDDGRSDRHGRGAHRRLDDDDDRHELQRANDEQAAAQP